MKFIHTPTGRHHIPSWRDHVDPDAHYVTFWPDERPVRRRAWCWPAVWAVAGFAAGNAFMWWLVRLELF